MQGLSQLRLDVTTAADGTGSAQSSKPVFGWVYAILSIDGSFDDGIDATFTCEPPNGAQLSRTVAVLTNTNDDKMFYPRSVEHLDTSGADLSSYCFPLIDGYIKVAVVSGGNAKTGGFVVYYFQ